MNRDEEFAKLFKMIDLMAEYSILKPGQIDKACKEKAISSKYFPFTTLMVEAFFSIYSFTLLVKEALYSNASAILRTLIEQVSAVYVLTNNDSALDKFIEIKNLIALYENKEITLDEINTKYALHLSEKNIENFFDYGWSISFGAHNWGRNKIIKESKLDEVLEDFWYLNKFAHGQLSWYQLLRTNSKEILDRHIARTIMICGKLFNYLCSATVKYFGENVESDESYVMFAKIKTLYLNINTYAIRRIVVEKFKKNEDVAPLMEQHIKSTRSSLSMLLEYKFDYLTKNLLAVTCFRQMETVIVMFAYLHSNHDKYQFNEINLYETLKQNVCSQLEEMYGRIHSRIEFQLFINMLSKMDDMWGPFKNNQFASKLDEEFFITVLKLFNAIDLKTYRDNVDDEGKQIIADLYEAIIAKDTEKINKIKYEFVMYGSNILSVVWNYIFLTHNMSVDFEFGYKTIKKGTKLFRIRRFEEGVDFSDPAQWSYPPHMPENRANVEGEPTLYLGTTEEVCRLETHIENGEKYVLGEYEVQEDIKLGGFIDFENHKSTTCYQTGVILNAFLIAPSRNEKNKDLFDYLDNKYKDLQLNDIKISDAKAIDLPLKFGTINKKNEFYKLTNKLLFSIKKKYPDGINYSSCFIPASTIGIYCSDTNIALYDKGMKKIKFISSTIKTNDKKYCGADVIKTIVK